MDKEVFFGYVTERISHFPQLNYEWDEDRSEILFRGSPHNGFDVRFGYDVASFYVTTSVHFHEHFDLIGSEEENGYEIFLEAFRLVRDLLGPGVRIREVLAGPKPRKWILEYFEEGSWVADRMVGDMLWNYLAPKTELYYSNVVLPEE